MTGNDGSTWTDAALERAGDIVVEEAPGSEVTLLAFGGLRLEIGMPVFEFFAFTRDLPCRKVFVRDRARRFYHFPLEELGPTFESGTEVLRDVLGSGPVVAVGTSAGALAAMVYGARLRVERVLAFGAVTFLDEERRRLHDDTRWMPAVRPINARRDVQRRYLDVRQVLDEDAMPPTVFDVYFGADNRLDVAHAQHVAGHPQVELHPLPIDDHNVAKHLKRRGELGPIIVRALERAARR